VLMHCGISLCLWLVYIIPRFEFFFCFVFSLVVVFWDKFSVVFVRFWHCVFSPFGFAVLTPVSAGSVWAFV